MRRKIFLGTVLLGLLGLLVLGGLAYWTWDIDQTWSPLIEPRLRERQSLGSIRILAMDPRTQNEQWIGSLTSGRTEERQPLGLADIPPQLTQAIVTLEDPRFLEHGGFDVLGILRAFLQNLRALRYSQGGSTITQQLVKNVFLSNEKTLRRKFTELILSALVEKRFSKDEILEAYMNEVYLGQVNSIEIHGVGRAAEYYFGKEVGHLDVHEMALLAAMIAGPGYYSPWRHPERTLARRNRVLKGMADSQLLLESELERALAQSLPTHPHAVVTAARAGYLMDALREELVEERPEVEVLKGGFDVHLDLDLLFQETAEKILKARAMQWKDVQMQGLLVAADPQTCAFRAYVGGTDYSVTQLDRIRQSRRPIGSLMKPLELIVPLDQDNTLSLATRLEDRPLTWSFDEGRQTWSPANYDGKYRGFVSLRKALEDSINVPIVRVFFDREPSGLLMNILSPLRGMGLEIPPERALPSALLGAIDQTPRAALTAYVKFVRQTMGWAPDAADLGCRLHFEKKSETETLQSASMGNGYAQSGSRLVMAALEGALRRGTGQFLGKQLSVGQSWASKTGTSSDSRDAWYVALSPRLVVLSWVGRDDNRATKLTGASGALPLVSDFLKGANLSAEEWDWPLPEGSEWLPYNVDRACYPDSETFHRLRLNTMTPKKGTPPPEPFVFEQEQYLYELFRVGVRPPECEKSASKN